MQYENAEEEYLARGQEVVLHEDKQYYAGAEEVFGKDVEALIEEEDHQPLTKPIIEPPKTKMHVVLTKEVPETKYSIDYMAQLMAKPKFIRNVAIIGHQHHGKTLLSDLLIESTYSKPKMNQIPQKYTDLRVDEINRQISIKAAPFQILLEDSREKNYVFNFIDTPGHPDFSDEVSVGLRLADSVLLVVDVVEGVTLHLNDLIKMCLKQDKQMILVLNKIDRLVLELKLPPNDAYHKIKHTLDEVNITVQKFRAHLPETNTSKKVYFSPLHSNVIFASTLYQCCFSLETFAEIYL